MKTSRGFTLIEAVMVIAITGILGAVVAVFIRGPVQGYFDSTRRADLTDAADTTLKRIARDVRLALPNSLRSTSGGSNQCFEFLPMVGGGRYRAAQSSVPSGNILDFSIADISFNVLADDGVSSLPAGVNHVVVYNLGIAGADAYNGDNRQSINGVAGAAPGMTVTLNAGMKFPFESPGNRFQVIPDYAVVYSCSGTSLYRVTRAISATPLATCPAPAGAVVVVSNVNCAASSFKYTPAVSQRNALLTITLTLTDTPSGESVQLYDQVQVSNVP